MQNSAQECTLNQLDTSIREGILESKVRNGKKNNNNNLDSIACLIGPSDTFLVNPDATENIWEPNGKRDPNSYCWILRIWVLCELVRQSNVYKTSESCGFHQKVMYCN